MYFRWKDRRIVTEIAVWGAGEGTAPQFVHTLADAAARRVDAGELAPPDEERAVGLPRNAEAISVDEPDRSFTMFFCHPAGPSGEIHDHPVDFKISAPETPVENNNAFSTVLRGATAIIFLAEGRPEVDGAALDAIDRRIDNGFTESNLALRVVLTPEGTDTPDPNAFRRSHDLPDDTSIVTAEIWNADEAWRVLEDTTRQLRDHLEAASEDGRLPV